MKIDLERAKRIVTIFRRLATEETTLEQEFEVKEAKDFLDAAGQLDLLREHGLDGASYHAGLEVGYTLAQEEQAANAAGDK